MRAAVQAAAGLLLLGSLAFARPARCDPTTDWRARFERDRPSMLRAVDGIPGPPGYLREVHYDYRRLTLGTVSLALAVGLQLLAVSSQGVEAEELVPCAGLYLGDYGKSSGSSYIDSKSFGRMLLSIPVCALHVAGALQLSLALADPRPVWVRKQARRGSLRLSAGITDQSAGIHALAYF